MTNEFLPKIKKLKEDWKAKKEQDLTDDDIIAMIDEHLQRDITPDEKLSPEEKKALEQKEEELRRKNAQDTENDEIEQISKSLNKKMEELDKYIVDKKKEIDDKISKIKRKEPPSGDISDEASSPLERMRADSFEADA